MRIIVQKFGGTSVATQDKRLLAIEHIKDAVKDGYHVVVVVSAMGRKGDPYATDTLLGLLDSAEHCAKREKDLLMSCGEIISAVVFSSLLTEKGYDNCVLTGAQAGILTNDDHSNAQIITVTPDRILKELEEGKVVIVAGFQGAAGNGDITTLGRGGSDTTATALGVALNAEVVDIFTDVDGIMTADPRIVDDAKKLRTVTYAEICNLAYSGAKVIHPRSVEIAMQKNIPVRVRSTMSKDPGTLIISQAENDRMEPRSFKDQVLTGITQTANITQLKVDCAPTGGNQLKVFKAMADNQISVDFISVTPTGVAFTVSNEDVEKAVGVLLDLGFQPEVLSNCAKVSAVGAGIAGVPGVMATILEALTAEGIEVLQSADSHTTIWCLVREEDMVKAVRALHRKFKLHA
ncbi:aspartate kinase [Effusibacillus lacus]|uniref:Aspartokinase n=1 Tax=Effusibacillus lacus TaxID=1348429 RepID=A0A292YQA3_9BACL|nr:aspartate kinase [Effusibacillus lacus]TCS73180.1 aspartate kinase [Effusibacillus lacus]GAX90584.1 aspartate kinase [Effusibacillus lacus]